MDAENKASDENNSAPAMAKLNTSEGNKSWYEPEAFDFNEMNEQLEKTLRPSSSSHSSRRSLFNNNLIEISQPSSQVDEVMKYKELQQQRQHKFISFLLAAAEELKSLPQEDANCEPSEEHQRYLNQGPNLDQYARGAVEFMKKASAYLREIEELLELQSSLAEMSQCHLDDLSSNAIHRNLARS